MLLVTPLKSGHPLICRYSPARATIVGSRPFAPGRYGTGTYFGIQFRRGDHLAVSVNGGGMADNCRDCELDVLHRAVHFASALQANRSGWRLASPMERPVVGSERLQDLCQR